jgi:hypothetical protein
MDMPIAMVVYVAVCTFERRRLKVEFSEGLARLNWLERACS